ncbi:MAG: hypothetical protein U5K84_00180 [Alkalibacterium sp.]|nr:hypothetical protein [Alkalibacterium sp.]
MTIQERNGEVWISFDLPDIVDRLKGDIHGTHSLGRARLVNADFEDKQGQPLTLDTDFSGDRKGKNSEPMSLQFYYKRKKQL